MAADRVLVTHPFLRMLVPLDPTLYPIDVLPEDAAERQAWLIANGAGVRALVTSGIEPLPGALLALLPGLELIASVATGLDLLDVAAARARGIAVTNGGGLNSPDVAEFAVAQLLARRRDLAAADAWVRAGQWPTGRMPPSGSVSAERVGIVGLGTIGRGVAERLTPFGSAIRWWGPRAKPDAPWTYEPDLLALADWASTLVIAVPGTDDTRGLISREVLAALGPTGLLINVARGFVVDEAALKDLLRAGQLGGAALDVMVNEPDDGTGWADVPNVTLSPHVAGATRESLAAMMGGAADNVRRLFTGATQLVLTALNGNEFVEPVLFGRVVDLLTGDNAATAKTIATQAGIDDAHGNLLPEDKLTAIQGLQARHGKTGMTGDGINDAPALAQSDIGFAMGGAGTDTAMEAADVVIMNDDLRRIPEAIRLSRSTHSVLWQNISLALGIKAVFMVLAVFGTATMWMAVFADMGATLLVVANGLRLMKAGAEGRP